jgi:hypothetical protein
LAGTSSRPFSIKGQQVGNRSDTSQRLRRISATCPWLLGLRREPQRSNKAYRHRGAIRDANFPALDRSCKRYRTLPQRIRLDTARPQPLWATTHINVTMHNLIAEEPMSHASGLIRSPRMRDAGLLRIAFMRARDVAISTSQKALWLSDKRNNSSGRSGSADDL